MSHERQRTITSFSLAALVLSVLLGCLGMPITMSMTHEKCPYANKIGMVDCPQQDKAPSSGHAYHRCVVDTLSRATVSQAPEEPDGAGEAIARNEFSIVEFNDTGPPPFRRQQPDGLSRSPLRQLAFWSALHNKQDIPDRPAGAVPTEA